MQPLDLTDVLKGAPAGAWVALSSDKKRMTGTGKTAQEAANAARRNGEDHPILIKMPSHDEGVAASVR